MEHSTLSRLLFIIILILIVSTSTKAQIYVSANGNNKYTGELNQPLASLQKALEVAHNKRLNGDTSQINIYIRAGKYKITETIQINSSTPNIHISSYKNESVIFTGGIEIPIHSVQKIRLNDKDIFKVDLQELGIDNYGRIRNVGFARPLGVSWGELFVNGKSLHLSRWPNSAMIPMGEVLDEGSIPRNDDFSKRGGVFKYDSARISDWQNTNDIWISGYFKWGYADDAVQIAHIDKIHKTITTAQPTLYGFDSGASFRRWYAFNILEELDESGEFYLDREKGILYFMFTENPIKTLDFSLLEKPFISINNVANISIEGIHFKYSRALGIAMSNTENVIIKNCNFSNLGSLGITIGVGIEAFTDYKHEGEGIPKEGIVGSLQQHLYSNTTFVRRAGRNNRIINCDFFQLGAGGISLGGGNRLTLEVGNNSVENCLFHHINRIEKSYRPAVHLTGVGNKIIHCEIFNTPSMAILMHGNNHLIEYNNIHHICLDANDQGAIYYGRDPSELGNVINNNYFHHIPDKHSTCAIYHDDGACGLTVSNNIFYKAGRYAVLMGGGSNNTYQNNIFITGKMGIHIDNRLQNWSANVIKPGAIFEKRLNAVHYTKPPYSTQYPELKNYWDNVDFPKNNVFENNIFYKIDKTIDGEKQWLVFKKTNWETSEELSFADIEEQNFTLWDKSVVYQKLKDFQPIPFHQMGLIETAGRKTIRKRNGLLAPIAINNSARWEELQKQKQSYKVEDQNIIDIYTQIIEDTTIASFPNPHPNAQWFSEGNFGLFMHWGPPSINASQPSWAMIKHYPYGYEEIYSNPQQYFDLAHKFEPNNWNPDSICKAAKAAGMSYVVLTAKHHDGFALWPSKYGNYNMGSSQSQMDLLKPYVEACRKYGLKIGFYFSQQDWHFPEFPLMDQNFNHYCRNNYPIYDETLNSERYQQWLTFTIGQLNELLTSYGQIDILWFDGFYWPGKEKEHYTDAITHWIRNLQAGIVINDRWYKVRMPDTKEEKESKGDFATVEWKEPNTEIDKWWEFCTSWCSSWGYSPLRFDDKEALRLLIKARSLGGNFLLNIGPSSSGVPPKDFYPYMQQLSKWIQPNKEALLGSGFEKTNSKLSNVMISKKGNIFYLHILPGTSVTDIELLADIDVKKMYLLAEHKKIRYNRQDEIYVISINKNHLSNNNYHVIAVEINNAE